MFSFRSIRIRVQIKSWFPGPVQRQAYHVVNAPVCCGRGEGMAVVVPTVPHDAAISTAVFTAVFTAVVDTAVVEFVFLFFCLRFLVGNRRHSLRLA